MSILNLPDITIDLVIGANRVFFGPFHLRMVIVSSFTGGEFFAAEEYYQNIVPSSGLRRTIYNLR